MMKELIAITKTRKLLASNDVIPFWKQMEILIALDDKDADVRVKDHYGQFLKDKTITQEQYDKLIAGLGTH